MSVTPPPIYAPMVDEHGVVTLPWILFFNGQFGGDEGTAWTPTFTSLTETGTASFSGTYYKLSAKLLYFTAVVTPATDTTATAGTTYIGDLPFTITTDGACHGVSGFTGSIAGVAQASSQRIYVPGWSLIPVPVTVCGLIEAA